MLVPRGQVGLTTSGPDNSYYRKVARSRRELRQQYVQPSNPLLVTKDEARGPGDCLKRLR